VLPPKKISIYLRADCSKRYRLPKRSSLTKPGCNLILDIKIKITILM
jgi:hypothetical protein